MPGPLTGFINGFQTQITADVLSSDTVLSFPTAGMVRGLQYVIRIDDSNPPTTFEYALVQFRDSASVNVIGGTAGRGYGGGAPANHSQGVNSGFVTAVLLDESLRGAFARIDTENFMAFASASGVSGQFFNVYGLPGATQPTRYVGATSGGAPASGSFLVGDFALDTANNIIWICTVLGSPGTWQNILDGYNTGLTGAVSSVTRWVGATGADAPTSGTWGRGDVVTDRSGTVWVCAVAGTPGTWYELASTGLPFSYQYAAGVAAAASSYGTVPVKFAEVLLGADTASVTFSSIPATFRTIRGSCMARESTAVVSDNLLIYFNNDTAANYNDERMIATAAAASGSEVLATAVPRLSAMPGASGTAGYFSHCSFFIPMYAGVTGNKACIAHSGQSNNNVAGQSFAAVNAVIWKTTATAINRIDIKPTSNNLVTGSYFCLYLEP